MRLGAIHVVYFTTYGALHRWCFLLLSSPLLLQDNVSDAQRTGREIAHALI
jgi:hypothetical protein